MTKTESERYEAMRALFESVDQAHVFAFWEELTAVERAALLDDLACIRAEALPALRARAVSGERSTAAEAGLTPAPVIPRASVGREVVDRGRALLAEGKVAALTVAGGQGTRLGFDGPKGMFPISPVRQKPLFQLFAESILATSRRYGSPIPWYVMTSPSNDATTRAFFDRQGYFGLSPDQVRFFKQGVLPAFDGSGRILLDRKHRVALAPDGHGGTLLAMAETGVLDDLAARGVAFISYFQVDNPLVFCLDPVFIGLHAAHDSEMSSKTLPKADDLERVGNFVTAGDHVKVIEYSDLPEDVARARNADGSRMFDAANIAIHVLSRSFVERLTSDRASFALPWHVAKKKTPFVDLETGERVVPAAPNAVRLEAFIFDALPLARNPVLLGSSRAEEFSPVKNPTGVDSVETARRDLIRRAARWLEAAGIPVPRGGDGEPSACCEISPLAALDAAELAARAGAGGDLKLRPPRAGEAYYVAGPEGAGV